MAIADIEGACSKTKNEYLKLHVPFREQFKQAINKPFDFVKFKKEEGLRGCVIQMAGMSASGKSHFIHKIKDYLISKEVSPNAILVVERDQIMGNITLKRMGGKTKTSLEGNPECLLKPEGELYTELYTEQKRLGLGKVINKKMAKMISDTSLEIK